MWNSLRRGFGFLGQAAGMATKDPDLLKPSVYSLIVGAVAAVVLAVPTLVLTFLLQDSKLGGIILLVMLFITFFIQFAITYIFAGMTVRLVYDYLTQGDGRMDRAWDVVRRDFFDILTLAAVSALVKVVESMANSRRGRNRNAMGGIAALLASILNRVWTVATYFILPAMIIEDLDLSRGIKRATQVIKDNLLLVGVAEIGVGSVIGLIGFLLIVLGIALGVGLFFLIASLADWATTAVVIGAAAGILLGAAVVIVVLVLSSYVTTAYHTCLFVWAREVEQARAQGVPDARVAAPAPLAGLVG
jgi:hypothetical protein